MFTTYMDGRLLFPSRARAGKVTYVIIDGAAEESEEIELES